MCTHHIITTNTCAHSHIQFTCVRLPVPANTCAVHALTYSNTLVRACEYTQTFKYYKGLGKHVLCIHAQVTCVISGQIKFTLETQNKKVDLQKWILVSKMHFIVKPGHLKEPEIRKW